MIEYVPTTLVAVAAVLAVGFVVNTASVSPFAKPNIVVVNRGLAAPYTFVLFSAATVKFALVTVNVPSV